MTLANLSTVTKVVKAPGGEFSVRGLSLSDILVLVSAHRKAMSELFETFANSGSDANLENTQKLAGSVISSAPALAAEIIALAADEPTEIENAKRLPFPAQLEALEIIGELTFATVGSPKKVVEIVIRAMEGASSLMDSVTA